MITWLNDAASGCRSAGNDRFHYDETGIQVREGKSKARFSLSQFDLIRSLVLSSLRWWERKEISKTIEIVGPVDLSNSL